VSGACALLLHVPGASFLAMGASQCVLGAKMYVSLPF